MQTKAIQLAAPWVITIVEEAPIVQNAIEKIWELIKDEVELEGYRKGKISREIAEAKIGRRSLYEEYLTSVYFNAAKQCGIIPVGVRSYEVDVFEDNKPLVMRVTIDVAPEIILGQYKQVEIIQSKIEVTDEEIEASIQAYQLRAWQKEEVNIPVEENHIVDISYTTNIEGSIKEQKALIEVGKKIFLPAFEEQLLGMQTNEIKEFTLTLPNEFGPNASKDCIFKVTINNISNKIIPAIDDELAKVHGCNDLEEWNKQVKKELYDKKQHRADKELEIALFDKIIAKSTIAPIPEVLILRQLDNLLRDILDKVHLSEAEYFKASRVNRAQFNAQYAKQCLKDVERRLILEAIAEKEQIEVNEDEIVSFLKEALPGEAKYSEMDQYLATQNIKGQRAAKLILNSVIVAEV